MRSAPEPDEYDNAHVVDNGRSDFQIAVGFDDPGERAPCFLVTLYYATNFAPVQWTEIARFDHNETAETGHDIYDEGLHLDVTRLNENEKTVRPSHGAVPRNRGIVIRRCVDYFEQHVDWFIDVYTGAKSPVDPPDWL